MQTAPNPRFPGAAFLGASLVAVALSCLGAALPRATAAADVQALVKDDGGQPVASAVITLTPADGSGAATAASASATAATDPALAAATIDQRNETFIPAVVLVARGGAVTFHNADNTRHHVYSFSPVKSFEFVLNPGDASTPVRFDKPGVAAIGCNIHDHMAAFVYVTDSRWSAITDKDGRASFTGVAPGAYVATIWDRRLRPGSAQPTMPVTVAASGGPTAFTATLGLPSAAKRQNRRDREKTDY
jgi:plastocyanin